MTWLLFAFAGPVLWAVSTHIDKYLVERFFKRSNVAAFLVFTAWIGLLALPVIEIFRPEVIALSVGSMLVIGASGVLYLAAMYFYLKALQDEEASVIAPFFQLGPLFGYGLAYIVLGETLSRHQLAGGALVMFAALLLSVERDPQKRRRFKLRLVLLMLACALSIAVSTVIFKFFAVRDEFWTTMFWSFLGQGVFGIVLMLHPENRAQFIAILRANPVALLSINGANELINLGGGLSARYALLLAPLSLVQAIGGTTTLFVFFFGVALSLFLPRLGREDMSPANLTQKGLCALLVVAGVVLLGI